MEAKPNLRHRVFHALVATAVVFSVVVVAQAARPSTAGAVVPPIADTDGQVTADALPTVQIDGVVWQQTIVGNTVYAVGQFNNARPAGAAPGTNQTPRSNILAYNLTTGELIQSFAPTVNGTIKAVTPSPDGSRIYIGGLFTSVNGQNAYRLAALNATTGAFISSFTPILSYAVDAIVATGSTVYVGGEFGYAGSANSTVRSRLAAFSASNGALTSWNPSADDAVHAMVMSPKGDRLFIGGAFTNVNGTSTNGLAALDPQTGARVSWPVDTVIKNSGNGSSILSLATDGTSIFGAGYAWGQTPGSIEGSFSANPDTGAINWVEDCHGDSYSVAPANGHLYVANHMHYCGNIGSFPQSETWADNMQHAASFTTDARGTIRREVWRYPNWEGYPAPSQVNWYPNLTPGTFTGQSQAAWSVAANNQYVVYGGEFPSVNGTPQQGLVRFAVKPIAPAKQGPRDYAPNWSLEARSNAAGQVRLTVPANWDRDDAELNYRFTRDGQTIDEQTVSSSFWNRPVVSFTDTGLAPGSSHTYRVWASDDDGNLSNTDTTTVTVASAGAPSAYSDAVMADGARIQWRLGSAAGGKTEDTVGTQDGNVVGGVSFGAAGAVSNDPAATFPSSDAYVYAPTRGVIPDLFSIEAWVKTSSSRGGRIAGFGSGTTNDSSSSETDKLVYMTNSGQILFGVKTRPEGTGPVTSSTYRTVASPSGLNNNQWHHVVATLSSEGMVLFVDGKQVASRADTTDGVPFYGQFRVGADTLSGWPSRPTSSYLSGQIDEAALYGVALTPQQVANHYVLSGRTPAVPTAPADQYGAAVYAGGPSLYYRLADTSGTSAVDSGIEGNTGTFAGSVTKGQPGAIAGNAAVRFNGAASVAATNPDNSPGDFSTETWFNTTSTTGGELIGLGTSKTGNSSTVDRVVYMRNDGTLTFRSGVGSVTTAMSYRDGRWHHVVATQGPDGMHLYVDGTQVGASPTKVGLGIVGYWRVGGDAAQAGATSGSFTGLLDEAAVYPRALGASEVTNHFTLGGGVIPNTPPTASFTVGGSFLNLTVDGSASTDPDGSIASYAWTFGDGGTATGVTASHTYATAGTYTVTLTVTDNRGATNTTSSPVTVVAPDPGTPVILASDAFGRTASNGWGTADIGGAWTTSGGGASLFSVASGVGTMNLNAPGRLNRATLGTVSATDVTVSTDITMSATPTGGGVYTSLGARGNGSNDYRFKIRSMPTGTNLIIERVVNGANSIIVNTGTPIIYTPGDVWHVKMTVTGTSPTTITGKFWKDGTPEPAQPQLSTTDSTPELQTAGAVFIENYLSGTATNAPILINFDNYLVTKIG
ncbi:MAG: PKD domain-containing protein [Actinobacteria bacterium]|nr:PKD domain-containing protein [Actinomycetota bacterium]